VKLSVSYLILLQSQKWDQKNVLHVIVLWSIACTTSK